MQKNETIINQFARTIKESPLDVKGDPVLLNRIFDELEKKKKRKFLQIFLTLSFVLIGLSFVVWGISLRNGEQGKIKRMALSNHSATEIPQNVVLPAMNDVEEKTDVVTKTGSNKTKKANTITTKKENADFKNVVSYKFNNHQVDVFENGDEEFIQINVFGADGVEQDVLKIMEDLKKSYRKNEVYVDSVKHK